MTNHLHHHHRSVTLTRPNHCFSSQWTSTKHSLNLCLSTETWSRFLGWWQGSMTKPLKVIHSITTCSSWSQKALSTWVSTTCSMFSVFWGRSSLPYHHLHAVKRILAARIPLPILTLQIVFQMKASKQGDSNLQLQSGRLLQPVLYSLQGGVWTMNQFGRLFQFPFCRLFFCLPDKTCTETRSFLARYFVWWVLRYTAGARISRCLALFI